MPVACPEKNDLAAYALGALPDDRSDEIDTHIETCAFCQAELATFSSAGDTFLCRLQGQESCDEYLNEPECAVVMARVAAIGREPSFASVRQLGEVEAAVHDLDKIGPYRVLAKLGAGGMGTVYKALHTELEKVVAIKVLPIGRMQDERAVARFKRESRAVGKLDDPYIVRATDAGHVEDTHFLVMEYVDGFDLSNLVARVGPLSIANACEIIRQAAIGLEHVREHGLVHRDIKPSNLMLSQSGQVKVLDLGLALLAEHHSDAGDELTGSGQLMGTLDYMAPEQTSDSHLVDIRADIYSLGATLYKLLAGHAPIADAKLNTPLKKMRALATQQVRPLSDVRSDVPQQLEAIVRRMLDHDPNARPATPAEVATALEPFTAGYNLQDLIAEAAKHQAPVKEQGAKQTFDYLSSAYTDTSPGPATVVPPIAAQGIRGRVSRRFVAALLLLLVGGIAAWQIAAFANQRRRTAERDETSREERTNRKDTKRAEKPTDRARDSAATIGLPAFLKGKDKVTVELPGKYTEYTFGGGGRYLIFRFDELRKAAIMDVTKGKIVGEIPDVSRGDLLAANATHLFVVMPGQMLIQRWSLKNLERERIVRIDGGQTPVVAITGAAGNGPLLLLGKKGQLFDPETLKIKKVTGDGVIGEIDEYGYSICVSANGLVFGGIPVGYGAVAHSVMKVDDDRTTVHPLGSTSQAIRWAQPSADGYIVFTPSAGIYDALGRAITADWLIDRLLIPTFDPRYFLALRYVDGKVSLEVGTIADRRIIYTETGFKELLAERVSSWHDIMGATMSGREPRFQWLVDQKMLVTLPATNDKVIFRPWDVPSLVKKTGEDFLWLASLPPSVVHKGEKLRYQVRVVSRSKELKYRVAEGPKGMSISRNGQVAWDVPGTYADATAPIIITVTDSEGNELIHSFEIKVAPKEKVVKDELLPKDI